MIQVFQREHFTRTKYSLITKFFNGSSRSTKGSQTWDLLWEAQAQGRQMCCWTRTSSPRSTSPSSVSMHPDPRYCNLTILDQFSKHKMTTIMTSIFFHPKSRDLKGPPPMWGRLWRRWTTTARCSSRWPSKSGAVLARRATPWRNASWEVEISQKYKIPSELRILWHPEVGIFHRFFCSLLD